MITQSKSTIKIKFLKINDNLQIPNDPYNKRTCIYLLSAH